MCIRDRFRFVLTVFGKLKLDKTQKKKLVGIVGEIYVKFSPLGNNRLEEFLLSEGGEPGLPGLMDFCLYCIYNSVIDHELYSRNGKTAAVYKMVYQFVLGKQADIIKMMKKDGHFRPPMPFDEVRKKSHAIIGQGVKMGEGWLLPAEMVELISEGVTNIVCTQPFGCLPNHIAGKGMIRKIREVYPQANIGAADYDPGASKINPVSYTHLSLRGTLLALAGVVNAECNVGGLLVDGGQDSAGVAVKAVLRAVVADLTNRVADNLRDIHIAGSGNLAHYLNHTGGAGGLAGYAGIRILR